MKLLLMFGAPGAGKGTQSKKIIEKFGYAHVSTGDMLRTAISNKTPLGLKAAEYMDAGNLVPDEIVTNLIAEVLAEKESCGGCVFDGFPRTVEQAKSLDKMLATKGLEVELMLALSVDKEELKERLTNRAKRENRDDDTPEVIANRIQVYEDKTAPVAEYYKKQNKYTEISGMGSVDEIFERITKIIEK